MNGLLSPPRPDTEQRSAAGLPAGADRAPSHPARRIVMGVLVGALTMFAVATLDTFGGATVPVLGTLAALPAPSDTPEVVEVPAPPATPGTCLSWSRQDAADTAVVDCGQAHLFEQAGAVTLTDLAALPDDRQWRQLVNERCGPVVLGYLNGKFDPAGRYRIGALKPSPAKWAEGDRELRCGLQSASRSGAMYPTVGRVADSDQSPVQDPGTCLAIDGRTVGDPVACDGPHAVETAGVVDLSAKFATAFPQVGDQDSFLQAECGRIADDYAGGAAVITAKKLTVYWDNVSEESWNAGTRKINCNLAALLPDRSGFAPVTGPVRGNVVVGDTAAPSAVPAPAGSTAPAEQPSDKAGEQPKPAGDAATPDLPELPVVPTGSPDPDVAVGGY